ncbi:MAG: aldehyde dehydrogenase family protein, partial [Bacteroidetes bacterium]|nr:aldehyde dehydrogenase family protein [Bacteroidota bacterium]
MVHGSFAYPLPENEPVRSYAPGTPERERVQARYKAMKAQGPIEIMARINGTAVSTQRHVSVTAPHEHGHVLGRAHLCGADEASTAMAAAMEARSAWAALSFEARAGIFMKAADLLAGPWRDTLNVATMLGQGKNIFQAEIDAACELIDFIRFNVAYAAQIYAEQPVSAEGIWNRLEYRPLEGFVFAVTPFNFTAIQANLALAPALMGNVVVWKPSNTALFSAHYLMDLFEAAGMPRGVINMLPGDGADVGEPILASPDLAGLHFTGSTGTFQQLWREIGSNIERYRSYPRIVGETGGKDFVLMHRSADPTAVATALVRGAFEFQGQKCSAASRAYIPRSQWEAVRKELVSQLSTISVGSPEDFSN